MKVVILMTVFLILGGCASAVDRHQQVSAQVSQPINCDTAGQDIAALLEERPSAGEKFANGIVLISPTTALFNLLSGEFTSRRSIATGKLNDILHMRISDIEKACDYQYEDDDAPTTNS
ncbi:hypothetical protein EYS14_11400 [Alteromonadaceae bacterium M269]|nr:hypothetical protein EYS14_11400 [Alteromonadaceae bacterium M269]